MSLREKIGQLFTFPAFAPKLDEVTSRLIKDFNIGGVFLGTDCLIDTEQVHRLTTALQQLSIQEGSGDTLLISADFVAGVGCKVKRGAIHFPKNRAIGAAADEQLAYESGRITAEESLAIGVNFNYSPVVDINNNPLNPVIGTHSFGEHREEVARLGTSIIRGYQEHGLIATAKHFPGHGDTSIDSHEDLPVLPFDRERLHSFELYPFQQAIKAGVDAVMVGHIAVPSMDPSLTPASLSYPITTGLLRQELGFEGLIVTDGLSMKGITNKYSMEEAGVLALQAGADVLLATTDSYEHSAAMFEAIVAAVMSGAISEARIDESVRRIRHIKQKYKLTAMHDNRFHVQHLQTELGKRTAISLARKAITVKGNMIEGQLQQDRDYGEKVHVLYDERCAHMAEHLQGQMAHGLKLSAFSDLGEALGKLREYDRNESVLLVTAGSKPLGAGQVSSIERGLSRTNKPAWVHFGSGYDVSDTTLPCLLLYDFAPALQTAAAEYLLGRLLE